MGYRFSLVLSREISDEESVTLQEAGCVSAVFGSDTLPTNAQVTVTKMDFDDTVSPSLAEAIESALEAVKKVPDLSVPGLTVPAQPAHAPAEETPEAGATVVEGTVVTEDSVAEPESAKKAAAKKPAAEKAAQDKEPVVAGAAAE